MYLVYVPCDSAIQDECDQQRLNIVLRDVELG